MQHKLLTTDSQLAELCQRAKELETISLDTEFLWERTFYPKLGLIQLALSDEECYLLDPLEILDLRPLGELLANPFIIKIFHDAPQDLAILARATGATPCNIFDTRLAAGFAARLDGAWRGTGASGVWMALPKPSRNACLS